MNPKAIHIINYMLERFLEREVEVFALPAESIQVSKDKMRIQHEVHLRVTKDLNLAISAGALLGLVQQSTGVASGVVRKGKPISPTDFFIGSTIIGGICIELEKHFDSLTIYITYIYLARICMTLLFEWDEVKNIANRQKHGDEDVYEEKL